MTVNFQKYRDNLLFVPLGGSNEIGMNLNLYTYQGKWIMLDCGIGFAHEWLPGIEVMVPDIDFIVQRKEDLLGLVLTHAHEDHIGAVPYLWRELGCPVYATPFTASLLKHKLAEMGPGPKPVINEIKPGGKLKLGPFSLDMIGITHSIPEMQALAIETPVGTVMHTGDWKFDDQPLVGPASDYAKLKAYGDKGILAMVCDSTNVFVEGHAGSEADVKKHLTDVIAQCENRVVVTTFASNIARIQTVMEAAHSCGRLIALAGRSMWRMVESAQEAGYLKDEHEFVNDREVMGLPRGDVVILCTGSQGEPRAALTRIAKGEHQSIKLSPADTVIFASRKIPGNEVRINNTMNNLAKKRIEVITDRDAFIHVSGHPARDELTKMYQLVRPKISIPTHGEARHLQEQARLAASLGVKETVEASNGAVILLEEGNATILGFVHSGYIAVDGTSLISTDSSIIRTRRKLRDDGAAHCTVVLDKKNAPAAPVVLSTPGLLDAEDDKELLLEIVGEIQVLADTLKSGAHDQYVQDLVRTNLKKIFKRELDKQPVIDVHVVRV